MNVVDDLETPSTFHGWWYEMLRLGRSAKDILEMVAWADDDISCCRQMLIAYHGSLSEKRDELFLRCSQAKDLRVRLYAKALISYLKIARHQSSDGLALASGRLIRPGLEADIRLLEQEDSTLLAREVCCALQVAIGACCVFEGRGAEGEEVVSNSLYWAEFIQAPYCIERARTLLIGMYSASGQTVAALDLISLVSDADMRSTSNKAYETRTRLFYLSQLGHLDEALSIDPKGMPDGSDKTAETQLQLTKLLWAVEDINKPILTSGNPAELEGKLSKSLQSLLKGFALPRASKFLHQRQKHFKEVGDIWLQPRQPWTFSWASFTASWLQAVAYVHSGRPDLARACLAGVSVPSQQSMDLRMLEAGIHLEIGLHLKEPKYDLKRWLTQLEECFIIARNEPRASPEGLAYRFEVWHPLAAAFAVSASDNFRELAGAIHAILHVRGPNAVYEIDTIPPALATEWALRALGFDQISAKFTQADVGRDRHKRQELYKSRGEYGYYRPVFSAAQIVFGLIKLGNYDAARESYEQYGVVPASKADYEMSILLQEVDKKVQQLLEGEITVNEYAHAVRTTGITSPSELG